MSEEPKTPDPEPEGAAREIDWKVESRKWERRAKENAAAAAELAELKEREKTDLQKAQDAQKAAEERLAEYERRAEVEKVRARVAAETGVPADLIAGGDEDEMRDFAKRLSDHYRPAPAPKMPQAGKFAGDAGDDPKRQLARQLFNN